MNKHVDTLQNEQQSFSEDEQAFLDAKLPALDAASARKFFDAGRWVSEDAGFFLTLEDETVGRLIYLATGGADIQLRGKKIGACGPGNFIGEISCLGGGPATATAMLTQDARYFTIDANELKRLCFAEPEIRRQLEHALNVDMREKLKAASLALAGRDA